MIPESRRWRTLWAGASRTAAWPFRVVAARATLRTLAAMNRRELADIGLSPSDLSDASALALDRDPTELLARRARERRRDAFGPPTSFGSDRSVDGPDDRPRRPELPRPAPQPAGLEAGLVRTG